jgi:hypothetical protein
MACLVSVNVGLPRDIQWRGRTVHTAIWKEPVQGRSRVKPLNVEGDGQADLGGHGGEQRAVFLQRGEGPVVLVSAGIGAIPVLAMLHTLAAGATSREVWVAARCTRRQVASVHRRTEMS